MGNELGIMARIDILRAQYKAKYGCWPDTVVMTPDNYQDAEKSPAFEASQFDKKIGKNGKINGLSIKLVRGDSLLMVSKVISIREK